MKLTALSSPIFGFISLNPPPFQPQADRHWLPYVCVEQCQSIEHPVKRIWLLSKNSRRFIHKATFLTENSNSSWAALLQTDQNYCKGGQLLY